MMATEHDLTFVSATIAAALVFAIGLVLLFRYLPLTMF
jgi:hypothetical protein